MWVTRDRKEGNRGHPRHQHGDQKRDVTHENRVWGEDDGRAISGHIFRTDRSMRRDSGLP